MADDNPSTNQTSDDLPSYVPIPPEEADKDQETDAAAAVEPGDTHPVFGSNVQPQEIYDEKIVGPVQTGETPADEASMGGFDPENDPRTHQQLPADEE